MEKIGKGMVIVELSEELNEFKQEEVIGLKAPKAKDIDRWLSAPNRFDLPKVETNKPKQDWTNFHLSLNCQKRDLLA